jgi:hypothetical protein
MPITFDTLKVTDEPQVLRGKWKEIKGRYVEVLKAKHIVFNQDVGPMLDKRAAQWKKLDAWMDRKLPRVALITAIGRAKVKSELNTLVSNGEALERATTGYKNAIHNVLGNPAERELTNALDEIISDAQSDQRIGNNLLNDLG